MRRKKKAEMKKILEKIQQRFPRRPKPYLWVMLRKQMI